MTSRSRTLRLPWLAAAMALTLAACGGSDDPAPAPEPPPAPTPAPQPPPPPPVTLSGVVARGGLLKNVQVCLDVNANNVCDAGEPASARTGDDGAYSLTYDPVSVPNAAKASLIAPVVPGAVTDAATTIDIATPTEAATTTAYVLKRVPGSGGAINPLTTLVAAGVADGMTEAVARANVAIQLAIAESKIDNYQDDPPLDYARVQDGARAVAVFTATALKEGASLQLVDQASAASAGEILDELWFKDSTNYYFRTLQTMPKAAGTTPTLVTDARTGKTSGAARPDTDSSGSLYRGAYLTPAGWKMCTRDMPIQVTRGNPSRSVFCETLHAITYTKSSSVAGQAMADLVTRWKGQPTNRINVDGTPDANLIGALGNAKFPDGAQEQVRTGLTLKPTISIDNTWTRGLSQTSGSTLSELVAKNPASAVKLPNWAGTIDLGWGSAKNKNLRFAFKEASSATAGTVQFYECDLNAAGNSFLPEPNCKSTTTGTYTVDTVNGARIMRFAGHPPITELMTYNVVYTEIDWGQNNRWVYRAHESKPGVAHNVASSNRLNGTAWAAMKTQLGL